MSNGKLTPDQIRKILYETIADYFVVELEKITPEWTFKDDIHADSLDFVEFSMKLDQEFGIQLNDEEMESVVTVNDLETILLKYKTE